MSLPVAAVWEVRNGGSDVNGGGFNSARGGTDYTLQNAAQATGTGTVAGTTLTATTGIFTSAMVGNCVTDGTNWREITAFTSSTVVTIDSTVAWTAASIKVGGALATPGQAAGNMANFGGSFCFVKYNASAYVLSTATGNVSGGPVNWPNFVGGMTFAGYDTTRTVGNTDANRPTVQVPGAGVSSITVLGTTGGSARGNAFYNLIADGQSKTSIRGFAGGDRSTFWRCKAINCTNSAFSTPQDICVNCEAAGCSSAVAFLGSGGSGGCCYGCVAHDNSVTGFSGVGTAVSCISYGNTGSSDGFIDGNSGNGLYNCTAYNNGGNGFTLTTASGFLGGTVAFNCVSYGNTGYGFDLGTLLTIGNYAAGSNTGGNTHGTPTMGIGTVIPLTANPFTNAAGGDFSLNNTAGGGAALRAAGFPGVFPGGTTTGYLDVGAVQHADPAGGSGAGGGFLSSQQLILTNQMTPY